MYSCVRSLFVVVFASMFAAFGGSAWPQDFPSRPIRIIVANTPGSTADIVPRVIAPEMAKTLGQSIVIENKPGADSVIGYEYVAKQPADGYTLASVIVPGLVALPLMVKELRFDPLRDLTPVVEFVEQRLLLASSSKLPWKNLSEFVATAKVDPSKLNYAASGTNIRLLTESLLNDLGLTITYVPYVGAAPYFQGLVRGDVHIGLAAETQTIANRDSLRALAQTGRQRSSAFSDVPTFSELGHPQIAGVISSLNVPTGTPKAIVDRLNAAASRALQNPDIRAQFSKLRMEILDTPPEASARNLTSLANLFAGIAKKGGVQAK